MDYGIQVAGGITIILSLVIRWTSRKTFLAELMASVGLLLIFWPSMSQVPYGVWLFIALVILLLGMNLAERRDSKSGTTKVLAVLTVIVLFFSAWWIR